MRTRHLAALAAVAALASSCAGGSRISTQAPTSPPPQAQARACHTPATGSPPAGNGELAGPAASALTGGAARSPISLDGGAFRLTPPPANSRPAITEASIVCEALASDEMNGMQFANSATAGMAVGYGLVTVSPSVKSENLMFDQTGMPRAPAAPEYDHRLAWVVVTAQEQAASCPTMSAPHGPPPSPSTTMPRQPSWNYSIFLADAATGSDTLVYTEATPPPCGGSGLDGPYRSVPVETISVPWTLESRGRHGYSGQIEAQVPPCWTAPGAVNVERGTDIVLVPARAVAGQTCGPARPVQVTLRADTVFDDLPAHLVPAPLGPLDTSSSSQPLPAPANHGRLISLAGLKSGSTLTVHVGDVLFAQPPLVPLPAQTSNGDSIRSTNPAVLGLLAPSAQSLPELRAWETGRSVLSTPTGWSVTVVVASR